MFGSAPGSFPIAESISGRTIALPFFGTLTEREIDLVVQTLDMLPGSRRTRSSGRVHAGLSGR
jgi:dTDP-4-amino-4,6-dideoxygalactose transaminase